MHTFLVLFAAITAVVARSPYTGYHDRVGIPLAARLKEAESAAVQSGSRIIGGQPAPLGAHPYLSTLFTLVFGSEHIFFGGVRVNTTDVEVHPGWVNMALEYDIAIVRVSHVAYTDVIQPISLPTGALESNDFVGVWAQASGYGMIGDGIPLQPNQVQSHVTLQVMSNDACRQFYSASIVTHRILCTSGAGTVGVCSSDSGGPLSIVDNNQRFLIGVVSFGSFFCESGSPSGFVRVTEHLPWIRERL